MDRRSAGLKNVKMPQLMLFMAYFDCWKLQDHQSHTFGPGRSVSEEVGESFHQRTFSWRKGDFFELEGEMLVGRMRGCLLSGIEGVKKICCLGKMQLQYGGCNC